MQCKATNSFKSAYIEVCNWNEFNGFSSLKIFYEQVVADIHRAIAYLGFSFCCSKCKKPDMFLPRRSFRYARLLQDGMGCYDGSAGNVCQVSVFLYYAVNLTHHPGVVLCSAMNASSGSVNGKIT